MSTSGSNYIVTFWLCWIPRFFQWGHARHSKIRQQNLFRSQFHLGPDAYLFPVFPESNIYRFLGCSIQLCLSFEPLVVFVLASFSMCLLDWVAPTFSCARHCVSSRNSSFACLFTYTEKHFPTHFFVLTSRFSLRTLWCWGLFCAGRVRLLCPWQRPPIGSLDSWPLRVQTKLLLRL